MSEPKTDAEYEEAIKKNGYELIDHGDDSYSIRCIERGGVTRLEADNYSDALFEGYTLTKP